MGELADNGYSYTENEFRYAVEKGKPVLAFIYGDRKNLTISETDDDEAKMTLLKAFVQHLEQRRIVRYWITKEELASAVKDSVYDMSRRRPACGWVRGNEAADPEIYKRIEELRDENAALQIALSSSHEAVRFPVDIAHGSDVYVIEYVILVRKYESINKSLFPPSYEELEHSRGSFELSWDEILDILIDCIYAERTEDYIEDVLQEYLGSKVVVPEDLIHRLGMIGSPVQQIRYQFERLGLISSFTKETDQISTFSSDLICWRLTDKGRSYISELKAIRRNK